MTTAVAVKRLSWNFKRMEGGECSLVVQWLRIHLPRQGTWVPSLLRATKPLPHRPGASTLQLLNGLQRLKTMRPGALSPQQGKPRQ